MNLFRAEWSRLFARRFTWIMVIVGILMLAGVGVGVALSSHRVTPEVRAEAEAQAQRQREGIAADRATCERAKANPEPIPTPADSNPKALPPDMPCSVITDDWVRAEVFLPNVFDFRREVPGLWQILAGVLVLVGFAVGASVVGAEWHSGGMTNLLLWRPRRLQVLLTKLSATLAGGAAIGLALTAVFAAALVGATLWRGQFGAVTTGSVLSLLIDTARYLGLGLAATAVGFALASLGRHTAMALGAVAGFALLDELITRIVLDVANIARPERWVLSSYVRAWMVKGIRLQDDSSCYSGGPCNPVMWKITMSDAALVGTGILLVLIVAAMVSMRRRDAA
jgi:hypothetical protein